MNLVLDQSNWEDFRNFLRRILPQGTLGSLLHYSQSKNFWQNDLHATINMMFDEKTLEPMYKLALGQLVVFYFWSSTKERISFSLINRAKKKIEVGKVRFDKTIATLQDTF
jgi:DNA mismatch repair protein MutS2